MAQLIISMRAYSAIEKRLIGYVGSLKVRNGNFYQGACLVSKIQQAFILENLNLYVVFNSAARHEEYLNETV